MTYQDAYGRLCAVSFNCKYREPGDTKCEDCFYDLRERIEEAFGKQIPKKPLVETIERINETTYLCPACRGSVDNFYGYQQPYCVECGQAIDWSGSR